MINEDKTLATVKQMMNEEYPGRTWFVVGGYFRDLDLGLPFKDVDVFVNGYATDPVPDTKDKGDRDAYLYYAVTKQYEGIEVNLIFMRGEFTLEEMTDRCDFGICQIGWCPVEDRLYQSMNYIQDCSNKTLTLLRSTAPERVERMQSKFPDYTFRNPQDLMVSDTLMVWHYDSDSKTVERVPTKRPSTTLHFDPLKGINRGGR